MSNVGAQLKTARESQEKTRADVARGTGILIHHLAALEHGNWDALPDDEIVAGFVKAYAEYLGFVADEPVAEFWAERGGEARAAVPDAPPVPVDRPTPVADAAPAARSTPAAATRTVADAVPRRARWPWILAGAAAVVVVLWATMRDRPEPETAAANRAAPAIVETTPAAPAEAEPAATDPSPEIEPTAPRRASTPEPEPRSPVRAPAAVAPTLVVGEYGVGTGVENRRLVGESDRFRIGTEVWFWTRVQGGRAGDEIRHVWIHEGRDFSTVTLTVGSSNWRTQSAKTMFDGSVGRWAVEARDAAGNVLARSEFTCER